MNAAHYRLNASVISEFQYKMNQALVPDFEIRFQVAELLEERLHRRWDNDHHQVFSMKGMGLYAHGTLVRITPAVAPVVRGSGNSLFCSG